MQWARSLATMIQVSLLGFAVGGAFLSLVYFDVPYYLMAAVVATRVIIERELKQIKTGTRGRVASPAVRESTAATDAASGPQTTESMKALFHQQSQEKSR